MATGVGRPRKYCRGRKCRCRAHGGATPESLTRRPIEPREKDLRKCGWVISENVVVDPSVGWTDSEARGLEGHLGITDQLLTAELRSPLLADQYITENTRLAITHL